MDTFIRPRDIEKRYKDARTLIVVLIVYEQRTNNLIEFDNYMFSFDEKLSFASLHAFGPFGDEEKLPFKSDSGSNMARSGKPLDSMSSNLISQISIIEN